MIETRFKETEVGRIPEDWEIRKMGQCFYLKGRIGWQGLKAHEFQKQGPFLVTGTDFENGHINWSKCYHITMQRFMQDTKIQVFENDVLITKDGTIGKLAFVNNVPGLVSLNSHLLIIRPLFKDIYNLYVYYHLKGKSFSDYVDATHTGTTMASLSQEKIANYKLILPSYDEQKCIATTLSNIDALISELGKLIEKKRAIKQGAMQQLLTGKKRLKGFKGEWCEIMLGEVAEILNGDRSERYPQNNEIQKRGIPFINAGHITDGKIDFTNMDYITRKKYNSMSGAKLQKGDILVCLRGSLGKNAKVEFSEGTVASSLCVIRTRIDKDYLCAILNSFYFSDFIKAENNGSSQPNLSAASVLNFLFPLPPTLGEQSAIANVLSLMDSEISTLEARLEKYTAIKQGMMQQLLTGKIRLI